VTLADQSALEAWNGVTLGGLPAGDLVIAANSVVL
jgi:hypothetical protein